MKLKYRLLIALYCFAAGVVLTSWHRTLVTPFDAAAPAYTLEDSAAYYVPCADTEGANEVTDEARSVIARGWRKVYFAPCRYVVTRTIEVGAGTHFIGEGSLFYAGLTRPMIRVPSTGKGPIYIDGLHVVALDDAR